MMLNISGLTFSYGSHAAVSDVSFEAAPGDIVAVLGPNGAGKSTLLKCINRIRVPDCGVVTVENADVSSMDRNEISKRLGYVPQSSHASGSTVFESVLIGRRPHMVGSVTDADVRLVTRIIDAAGLSSLSQKRVDEISGGEYQMVQIARALAQQPKVLLLDEPTSNLDLRNQYGILHLLTGIVKENGMAAVMINHDLNTALRFGDRFILMKDGRVFAAGGKEVITAENIRSVYGIDVTVGDVGGHAVVVPTSFSASDELRAFLSRRKKNPKQKDFFNERAAQWDQMSVHDPAKVTYIVDLLGIEPGMRLLDVGTGTGVMIPHYLERINGGRITAIDYSENMIAQAKMKYPESEKLSYDVADIYELDSVFAYDIVVCYSCFPHFPDPVKAVEKLSRALVPGGKFCVAHSSSKEHINHVHAAGGAEICTDYLPEADTMAEIFRMNGLDVVYARDDDDYYIVIGRKR